MDYCRRKVLLVKDKLEQLSQLVRGGGCLLGCWQLGLACADVLCCAVRCHRRASGSAMPRKHAALPLDAPNLPAPAPGCLQMKQRQAALAQVDALLEQRMGEQQAAGQQAAAGPAAAGQAK